jgi:hypothetical protein
VAYSTIKKSYQTLNGTKYDLQYDTSDGKVQLIQQGATTGTQPIFLNGKFNATLASQSGLTIQDQQAIYSGIQQEVKTAWANGGGKANNLTIPQWAAKGNDGTSPGTFSTTPAAAPSSNSGSSGGGIVGDLWGAITNPAEAIKAVSITNGNWGPPNEESIFKGTIKYPIDMKTTYQDHVMITQYRYLPPLSDKLLSGDYKDIIQNGLQKTSNFNKEKIIGTVYLPMPNSLADKMDVGWGPDNMNNLTAAVMADVINDPKKYAGAAGLGALVSKFLGGSAGAGAQTGATGLGALNVLTAGAGTPQGKALVGATVSSKLLQLAQFGVDVDSILARTAGIVPNSNLELMFGSPQLRSFSLSYKMTARDEQEAKIIRKILRFFKQGSAPKKQTGGAGQASYFLGTPNVFRIEFKNGTSKNKSVSMYKTLALTSIQTNYTAAGPMWSAYDDGQPVAVQMDLSFAELEPIFDTDYQTSVFQNTGLQKVEDDAVGY